MTKKRKKKRKEKKKIMSFILATNVVASQPPKQRPTGTPHARAKIRRLQSVTIINWVIFSIITTRFIKWRKCDNNVIIIINLLLQQQPLEPGGGTGGRTPEKT